MIRAQYKNNEYFEKYILVQEDRIGKFSEKMSSLNKSETSKISQCKKVLSRLYRDLISAKYSLGLSKEELENDVKAFLRYTEKPDSYNEMIDILSMMIIFGEDAKSYKGIVSNKEYDDALVVKLKKKLGISLNEDLDNLKFPNRYSIFDNYLDEKINAVQFISYLDEKWYDTCSDDYFYDSHNKGTNTYVGYWCWLAAAILKIKTSSVVKGKYIPFELI